MNTSADTTKRETKRTVSLPGPAAWRALFTTAVSSRAAGPLPAPTRN
jgi:hypothetical protein